MKISYQSKPQPTRGWATTSDSTERGSCVRVMPRAAMARLVLSFLLSGVILQAATGQIVPPSNENASSSKHQFEESLASLKNEKFTTLRQQCLDQIKSLDIAIRSISDSPANAWLLDSYSFEQEQLRYLELIYAQHQAIIENETDVEHNEKAIETELKRFYDQQMATSKFAVFAQVEKFRNAIDKQKMRIVTLNAELNSGDALQQVMSERLESVERERRKLKESIDVADNSQKSKRAQRKIVTVQMSATLTRASIAKIISENEFRQRELDVSEHRLELLNDILESMPADVVFLKQDLDEQLSTIKDRVSNLRRQLATLQGQLEPLHDYTDRTLEQESLTSIQRAEILKTAEFLRENLRLRIAYVNSTLSESIIVQYCWKTRYELAHDQFAEESWDTVHGIVENYGIRLAGDRKLIGLHLAESRGSHETFSGEISDEDKAGGPLQLWWEMRVRAVEELSRSGNQRLGHIQRTEQLFARLNTELDQVAAGDASGFSWTVLFGSMGDWWSYELIAVDDRPITLGKLISAVLMLFVGLFVARKLSRVIGNRLLPRFGVHEGGSHAMQAIAFYGLCLVFGFLTLEMLNIPLTVFTFLGGAAAIAIGFGSQTLLNNFISGLILLGEQPVRVGDLVEIDGVQGNIAHIGARATKIQTGSNLEIIVPNSKFMEQSFTNWTLADAEIRSEVKVGVAYGSPTEQVFELLERALEECEEVRAHPKPIILFSDFGSDALQFELHFWIHMRREMQAKLAGSNLRRIIDRIFREHDIVISYPQRDVHLDIARPIEVNLNNATPTRVARATRTTPETRTVRAA